MVIQINWGKARYTHGRNLTQACQKIAPHIPVVLMSGDTAEEVNSRFAGESFVGFLHKPFTLSELRQMLGSVLVHEGVTSNQEATIR